MINAESFEAIYNKNYKKLMIIALLVLAISFIIIGVQYAKTGDIFGKDVSLKGGVSATIYGEFNTAKLEEKIKAKYEGADIFIRTLSEFGGSKQIGAVIEASIAPEKEGELKAYLEESLGFKLTSENYSSESVGSSLGESFYKQMFIAMIMAFVLMSIVVLITFRKFILSITSVFCIFADLITTTAILNLIEFRISTAGIAALLLIIGYSIDSNILLTTRTIKRKGGTVFTRMVGAAKTGLTMSATAIIALGAGYIITTSLVLKEVFAILLIGLFVDIFYTYVLNTSILRWYTKNEA